MELKKYLGLVSMIKIFYTSILLIFFAQAHANSLQQSEHRIAILVNDYMITSYDIIQRMKMNSIINRIEISSENDQFFMNSVAEQLIQEKLKNEKIKEYEIKIDDEELNSYEANFLLSINFDKINLINLMETNNIKYSLLKDFLVIELSWQKLINTLYYRITSASNTEINEILSRNESLSANQAKNLVIQKQLDLNSSKLLRDMYNEATIEYR